VTHRGQAVRGDETAIEAKRPQSIVRERSKRLQVHDVLHVVLEEEIQCLRMTGPMGPPQADGIETAQPRGLLAPVDAEILLDRLEPAEETEAAERPHHVEVDLVQGHAGERFAEERHVEPGAVEGHEQLRPRKRVRQVLEVVSLDEAPFSMAIEHAHDGHRIAAEGEPRRLDVQERDMVSEVRPGSPMLPGRQGPREVAMAASVQRLHRSLELRLDPFPEARSDPRRHSAGHDIVPSTDAGPPQTLFRPIADAGDVDERFLEHPGNTSWPRRDIPCGEVAEPRKSTYSKRSHGRACSRCGTATDSPASGRWIRATVA